MPPIDDFERERRRRETANEVVINHLRGGFFTFALAGHWLNHVRPVAPFRSPLGTVLILAAAVLGSLGLVGYLRRSPPYRRGRKYLLTALELLVPVIGFAHLRHVVPAGIVGFAPPIVLMFLVALSGLRYSQRVVVFAGSLALVLHLVVFVPGVAPGLRLPAAGLACVGLIGTTLVVALLVGSLIGLHRESVLKARLARFLAPELVEELASKPELLERQTERRLATVLFTDIRGFTRLSEELPPDEVVRWLNRFLEEMTHAILEHRGMLDKYIGDSVMAVFGVPVASADHARRAVRSALDMRRRLEKLNLALVAEGGPMLEIGVGVHTGEVLVGAIGSSRRLEYTVIGDAVNVASRIEGLTRNYPADILISDATRNSAGPLVVDEIDTVQVKGRRGTVRLWAPGPPPDGRWTLAPGQSPYEGGDAP